MHTAIRGEKYSPHFRGIPMICGDSNKALSQTEKIRKIFSIVNYTSKFVVLRPGRAQPKMKKEC